MAYSTDGNLAALNAYQREQDELAEAEDRLERMQQELADDMFDAYVTNNGAVIAEVDDFLIGTFDLDLFLTKMRNAMTKECERPVMGRGCEIYDAYMRAISEACEDIAKRCTTPDEFDKFRMEYGV